MRYGVAALLAVVILSGCSGQGPNLPNVQGDNKPEEKNGKNEAAVERIQKLGGKVTRDDKLPGKPVIGVDLWGSKVKHADLKELLKEK